MSSLLLAGLTVLVIGDSHMANEGYLITTLHDGLRDQGAKVFSYGVCGANAENLMKGMPRKRNPQDDDGHCGFAYREEGGNVRKRAEDFGPTDPLPKLISKYHPDLLVVINGDTMASYTKKTLPVPDVNSHVKSLTGGIKAAGLKCVWVGPAWGNEGGDNGKNYPRVKEVSDFLAENVSPCIYINSLKMSKQGEWPPIPHGAGHFDGQHFQLSGYQAWGNAITKEIVSSDILQKIKH